MLKGFIEFDRCLNEWEDAHVSATLEDLGCVVEDAGYCEFDGVHRFTFQTPNISTLTKAQKVINNPETGLVIVDAYIKT
jgi:hypothetical protein